MLATTRLPHSTLLLLFTLALSSLMMRSDAWTPPRLAISVCDVRNAATTLAVGLTIASVVSDLSTPNIQQGKKIFDNTCASCHINGGNKIAPDKTLSRQDIEQYVGLDQSDLQQYLKADFVHRGANLFSGDLSDRDLQNVVAFVLNQATENKW